MAVPVAERLVGSRILCRAARLWLAAVVVLWTAVAVGAEETPTYYLYLAGPEVFLQNAVQAGEARKRQLDQMNATQGWPFRLVGLHPLDNEIPDFKPNRETALRIYRANIAMMDKADAIVANMVRFRGPGMDGGTAFEMGYMRGLGKPVFAYYDAKPFYGVSESAGLYADKVAQHVGHDPDNPAVDVDGLLIEDFGMADNLMMIGALDDAGTTLQASFAEAVLRIAEHLAHERHER